MNNIVNLSVLPPDLIVIASSLTMMQLLEIIQRKHIGPSIQSYRKISYRDRFDWDRRLSNVLFQVLQAMFNVYTLVYDKKVTQDVLYGYSEVSHIGLLIILSFYIYDSIGIVMHPLPSSNSNMWLLHHYITIGLLAYNISYKRSSAFPASIFLISSVSHIPNEIRWFLTVMNIRHRLTLRSVHILCFILVVLTCAVPPPYLIYESSKQLNISISQVVFHKMQSYCLFFFLLIYIPHVLLIFIQFKRVYLEWNRLPRPFRHKRVD